MKPVQIIIQSPDLNLPSKTVTLYPTESLTLTQLKHLYLTSQTLKSLIPNLYFSFNGRLLSSSLSLSTLPPLSSLLLRLRLPGGGGDGGSTCAESRDCYLNMYSIKKPDKVDPNETRISKWTTCCLSSEPLTNPIVIDKLGNLFNKEAILKSLVHKKLPKEFGHIRRMKDVIEVKIDGFECPVTGLEFNGKYGFFAIRKCGHVLSLKAYKEVKSDVCLVCHEKFEENDKIVINGNEEEVRVLRERMEKEMGRGKKEKKRASEELDKVANLENGKEKKKFRAIDVAPAHATKEVYASIFTSSRKGEIKETYSCRALPLGRN